eukprot:CAMPEP_0181343614 /NCGR_PEP_ID=MMETSP1101-20121128/31684_1 /TAXON_ID=46948 /ORGANISM="Rhodomonas abbreviata, Strain Caron Lab Isolate" /LENGTH=222 /DNA_ID=CAMNT_0023455263 /DNA_START=143 /DNA_END=808 /DNA_ORIENTATION=+
MAAVRCDLCEDEGADLFCKECNYHFCTLCCEAVHEEENRKNHTITSKVQSKKPSAPAADIKPIPPAVEVPKAAVHPPPVTVTKDIALPHETAAEPAIRAANSQSYTAERSQHDAAERSVAERSQSYAAEQTITSERPDRNAASLSSFDRHIPAHKSSNLTSNIDVESSLRSSIGTAHAVQLGSVQPWEAAGQKDDRSKEGQAILDPKRHTINDETDLLLAHA